MDNLIIYGTTKTPTVKLNCEEGILEFSGLSIPENALEFYQPIISWIKKYIAFPKQDSKLIFKLNYLNTSSLQAIYDIFVLIEGTGIKIEWYYLADDSDMKEMGEDFRNSVDVEMSLIEVVST